MNVMNNNIHPDLLIASQIAYEPSGFILNALEQSIESKEYGACTFTINNQVITFRVAKITPTKIGQFVTLWKRIDSGPIMPYDIADPIELFIISVRSDKKLGQFIFPKDILLQKGFISSDDIGGRRAMRVYPPWDKPDNRQAKNTQAWQLLYFAEIQPIFDIHRIQALLMQRKSL
ncbi:MepB family protein [Candidatus Dependentiae bacterium]|nr:MepB family protein [Candidatus Dependentiae bacterium]MCC7414991.1 MepB family protein [Campylobacterota bacterium]